jgi:hypothetical protein
MVKGDETLEEEEMERGKFLHAFVALNLRHQVISAKAAKIV